MIIKLAEYFYVGSSIRIDNMDKKYLTLLAKEFPTIDSTVTEIVNLSAIRSLHRARIIYVDDCLERTISYYIE